MPRTRRLPLPPCAALGLDAPGIAAGFASYVGLAHRMEEVGRIGRVVFINDSKATNADSTEKALTSFPGGIHWIVGGKAKEGGIESLAPLFPEHRPRLPDRRIER
jgi:UDP-N-acetylmuramoylalanine--D-glutamate ligase